MSTILDRIIAEKKQEVHRLQERRGMLQGRTDSARPFSPALRDRQGLAVIAEVKKASPSKGLIRPDFDPVAIARAYETGDASAVSVLTDVQFFQGSSEYLRQVRETVSLPVLRKDFVIDPLQVQESASMNADAMLLIAAALSDGQMAELIDAAREFDIEPLIEIHDGAELDRVMKLDPTLIGINNRDLASFTVDLRVTLSLRPHIPASVTVVSESGIFSASDTAPLIEAGVDAILVGESLMRSDDPAALIAELAHRR
jgi:indole-3-glycerol phosphate synthase